MEKDIGGNENGLGDHTDYGELQKLLDLEIIKNKTHQRFESFSQRERKSGFQKEQLELMCKGKYRTLWRGMQIMKDPLDCTIYQQLLWHEKPQTIIELGAYSGANAVWMADTMTSYQLPCHIYSLDIDLSLLRPLAKECKNVTFIEGDTMKIAESFPESMMKELPHPWVVSEDAHVNLYGCMEYFHNYMKPGDYFIIEDTNPDSPNVAGPGALDIKYDLWGYQKRDVLEEFMKKYEEYYAVDKFYTDFFGYNGTYNWDGYIKRIC